MARELDLDNIYLTIRISTTHWLHTSVEFNGHN